MVSRVSISVITLDVYQVARCGLQSVYLCYYCRCISGSEVRLRDRLPLLLSRCISHSKVWLAECLLTSTCCTCSLRTGIEHSRSESSIRSALSSHDVMYLTPEL